MTIATEPNGRRSIGQWLTIGIAAVALLGSAVGIYSSIHSDLIETKRSIEDLQRELSNLDRRSEKSQERQDNYNAELRSRIIDSNKEIRDSIRLLASKLIDKGQN